MNNPKKITVAGDTTGLRSRSESQSGAMRALVANIAKDFCGEHATDRPVVEGDVTPPILNLLRLLEHSVQKRQFVSM